MGMRLIPQWTRALRARYFLATFPIIEKKVEQDGRTNRKYFATRKFDAEKRAFRSFRLVEKGWSGKTGEVGEVREVSDVGKR